MDLEAARHAFAACREPLFERVLSGEWSVDDFRRGQLSEALAVWGPAPVGLLEEHAALREAMVGEAVLVQGARELVAGLRDRGLRVGVLTNGSPPLARRKLDALELAPLLDAVVTAEEAGAPKPDPRAYAAAAARLGLPAGRLAMVGDHLAWDVAGPLDAGYARALWLDRGTVDDPGELPPGATAVRTLAAVPGALGLAQAA